MTTIPPVLERLSHRYPSVLVDAVTRHDPGERIVAVKNVTVNEEFFQGHFPGTPLMPGVLMIEALTQVATLLLVGCDREGRQARLRGVDNAKFRRQVVPGDRLELDVRLGRRRGPSCARRRWRRSTARWWPRPSWSSSSSVRRAEAASWRGRRPSDRHRRARRRRRRRHRRRAVRVRSAPNVVLGEHCRVGASSVIEGCTTIGDDTEIYPFASIGLAPQDLKFRGEPTRLVIGSRNVFREFVTIHRGTAGGGGVTTIGDGNLFMAYAHVAHDCHVGRLEHLRQRRDDGRARDGRGLRHHQRLLGRPSVLPRGAARLHRRLHRRHARCAAVREDRRQPRPDLRRQLDRARAARFQRRS